MLCDAAARIMCGAPNEQTSALNDLVLCPLCAASPIERVGTKSPWRYIPSCHSIVVISLVRSGASVVVHAEARSTFIPMPATDFACSV